MKQIYILSGLGADERVFSKLDLSKYSTTFIKWEIPSMNESIEDYATRLVLQIKTPNPILIGLSFGGIIAMEIAKQIDTEKVILISSAKTYKEIPFYYRLLGKIGIHKLIPNQLLKSANLTTYWFFGLRNKEDKELLRIVLEETDAGFLKWAMDRIANWKNHHVPQNCVHIHGKADRILPEYFVQAEYIIEGGGHLMVLNQAKEVEKAIQEVLL